MVKFIKKLIKIPKQKVLICGNIYLSEYASIITREVAKLKSENSIICFMLFPDVSAILVEEVLKINSRQ